MELYEALLSRRTVHKYEDRPVPEESILRALEAARWAPNHKLTEPWRFYIVGPETRLALGRVAERLALEKAAQMPPEERERQVTRAIEKVTKLPALVVITVKRSPEDAFREREDYAAACCAAQNLQLSLWADGLGCQWGTGGVTRDDESYRILGIDKEAEDIIGFFKIGYPQDVPRTTRRPLEELTLRLP
jgi:nitroreductase